MKPHQSKFGIGPWNEEPDKLEWVESTPFGEVVCLIHRHPDLGFLRGYISIKQRFETPLMESAKEAFHGGVTHAEYIDNDLIMIGFDCAHIRDMIPYQNKRRDLFPNLPAYPKDYTYKDLGFCKDVIQKTLTSLRIKGYQEKWFD